MFEPDAKSIEHKHTLSPQRRLIITWVTKINKVKIFLPFLKLMKRPQTKFHAHTMSESQVIRSKKVKIYH